MPEEDVQHEYEIALELYKDNAYEEALKLLDRVAKERPESKHVMCARGLCLTGLDRLEEAQAVRDQLSGHHSSSARELLRKLDDKLQDKLAEREKALRKGQLRSSRSTQSEGSMPGGLGRPIKVLLVVILLAVCGVALAVFFAAKQNTAPVPTPTAPAASLGTGPDGYLESATFFPTDTERSFRYAVFLARPDGEVSNTPTDAKEDCVGNPVANDWKTVKEKAKKALVMSGSTAEEVDDAPRNKLVSTIVLPKSGTELSGKLEGRTIETFTPGTTKDLKSVVKACGDPDHTEMWSQQARCADLDSEVRWWGRIGLAADTEGNITHVLLRAYPGDKR